ncbi:hypothetical protein F5Y15DRAFT_416822 [Xylariaceae sp. FL0016]|nr:hypothetical protein F5Y15DRAFT_416822 [Xylariaceae sp. FL0016]
MDKAVEQMTQVKAMKDEVYRLECQTAEIDGQDRPQRSRVTDYTVDGKDAEESQTVEDTSQKKKNTITMQGATHGQKNTYAQLFADRLMKVRSSGCSSGAPEGRVPIAFQGNQTQRVPDSAYHSDGVNLHAFFDDDAFYASIFGHHHNFDHSAPDSRPERGLQSLPYPDEDFPSISDHIVPRHEEAQPENLAGQGPLLHNTSEHQPNALGQTPN